MEITSVQPAVTADVQIIKENLFLTHYGLTIGMAGADRRYLPPLENHARMPRGRRALFSR